MKPGYVVILIRGSIDRFQHNPLFATELQAALARREITSLIVDYEADPEAVMAAMEDDSCRFFICFNGFGSEITAEGRDGAPRSAYRVHGKRLFDLMHDCPAHLSMAHQWAARRPERTVFATDYRYATIAEDLGFADVLYVPSITFPEAMDFVPPPISERAHRILLPIGIGFEPLLQARLPEASRIYRPVVDQVCDACVADWHLDPIVEIRRACRKLGLDFDLTDKESRTVLTTVLDAVKFRRRRSLLHTLADLPVTVMTDRPYDQELPSGSRLTFIEPRSVRDLLRVMADSQIVLCPTPHMTGFHERPMAAFTAGAVVVSSPNRALATHFDNGRDFFFFGGETSLPGLLSKLLADPARMQAAADRGRAKALRLFPPDRLIDTMLSRLTLRRDKLPKASRPVTPISPPAAGRPAPARSKAGPTARVAAGANGADQVDLLIIDDKIPTTFSPFRTVEYGHYLSYFDTVLLTIERWEQPGDFEEHLATFPIDPALKSRIRRFPPETEINARLCYITFAANAWRALKYLKARGLPFVLQLYPGGGLRLDDATSDDRLRRVVELPLCRRVITTQTITSAYLIDRIGCDPEKVEFIYGGVFESRSSFDFHRDKLLYGDRKETLDICFVAHKYRDDLTGKGYDRFVAIARRLAADFPQLRFHVVGGFEAADADLGHAAEQTTFYGVRPNEFLPTLFRRMDIILSVNRPFATAPGAFDGFPTGACMEAGFHGVLNCISDPLGLNDYFVDGRDIVMLDFDDDRSVAILSDLLRDPHRLYELAYNNWRSFHRVLDVDRQLWARTRVITEELLRGQSGAGAAANE